MLEKRRNISRITISQELKEQLQRVKHLAELCDENGQVLGCFVPERDRSCLEPQVSEEELQRREKSDKWYTTEEVLRRLESLK